MNALKDFFNEATTLLASASVIDGKIKVITTENFDQKKSVDTFLSEHPEENILIVKVYKTPFMGRTFSAVFYSGELESERFAEQMLSSDFYPMMWEKGLWRCHFTSRQPFEEFLSSLKSKLFSDELQIQKTFLWSSFANDLAIMRSGLANDFREGYLCGMKDAQRLTYQFYCFATILQKSIEDATKGVFKDKMVLTALRDEMDAFRQSEDYQDYVEMNSCGTCRILSNHRQNFVNRMIELLDEITK